MCFNERKEGKPPHIVSVWSRKDGFCLGQKVIAEKIRKKCAWAFGGDIPERCQYNIR